MRPPRSAVKTLAAAVLCGVLTTGVAACGSTGTNGVATKSVGQIISTAKDAVVGAATFHVVGDLGTGPDHITVDLWLAKDKGASGHVTIDSQTLELLRIGKDVYLKGDAAFYSALSSGSATTASPTPGASGTPAAPGTTPGKTGTPAAPSTPAATPDAQKARAIQAMQGKYLHIGPADAQYPLYAALTDAGSLVDQILTGTGTLSKDGQKTINGTKTLVLTGSTPSTHVYVGIDGPAYLLRVVPAGGGTLDFRDYGTPVTLQAPPKTALVEISQIPAK